MEKSLLHLREITEKLPDLHELTGFNKGGFVSYNVSGGKGCGVCLFNVPGIAVQQVTYTKGMKFPSHTHTEIEIAVVYSGRFYCNTSLKGEIVMVPGDIVRFEPGESHSHEALEDTELIAITIPASKDYPSAY